MVIERIVNGGISADSMTIGAAMYILSLGLVSAYGTVFAICLLAALIFVALLGFIDTMSDPSALMFYEFMSISAIFCISIVDRFFEHFVDGKPCVRFSSGNKR